MIFMARFLPALMRLVCSQGGDYRSSDAHAGRRFDECADADRASRPPGRGFPVSQGRGPLRRRSQARRNAARGGAAQPRGAWPHPPDRCGGGARHAGRACGGDGGGYRCRLCRSSRCGWRTCRSSRAICSRSSPRTRCAMSASRSRWWSRRRKGRPRTRWRRSSSTSSDCRRCRTAMRRRRQSALFDGVSNRAVRYAATFGDADAAFAKAEYTRKENFALPPPDRTAAGDARPDRRMERRRG